MPEAEPALCDGLSSALLAPAFTNAAIAADRPQGQYVDRHAADGFRAVAATKGTVSKRPTVGEKMPGRTQTEVHLVSKYVQGLTLSKRHISRLWQQRAFSESVKTGGVHSVQASITA